MTKQSFTSTKALLAWAGKNVLAGRIDSVLIVSRDELFWYFSQDENNCCELMMVSSKNLSEGE